MLAKVTLWLHNFGMKTSAKQRWDTRAMKENKAVAEEM